MSGIVFYKTEKLQEIVHFYTNRIGSEVWLDQGKCVILKHGNMLFGFCEGEKADIDGILTFFYRTTTEVDAIYRRIEKDAEHSPRKNERFHIYHFFGLDPEGRKIEFQTFLHRLKEYWSGEQLLLYRRSIREFVAEDISEELLLKVFEVCRFAPTSRNSQSYYYVVTKDLKKKAILADIRQQASKPLAAAPYVVAVCVDSQKTKRAEQDCCIAGYHLLLAAAQFGLGTCWITDMNREEVKRILEIPVADHIACLTPLGYPAYDSLDSSEEELRQVSRAMMLPPRRKVKEIFRFV